MRPSMTLHPDRARAKHIMTVHNKYDFGTLGPNFNQLEAENGKPLLTIAVHWLASGRDWGNEVMYGYNGDSFPPYLTGQPGKTNRTLSGHRPAAHRRGLACWPHLPRAATMRAVPQWQWTWPGPTRWRYWSLRTYPGEKKHIGNEKDIKWHHFQTWRPWSHTMDDDDDDDDAFCAWKHHVSYLFQISE